MKALIIVDVQNDFLETGALPVPDASQIIPIINNLQSKFDIVVCTQDWHPDSHKSFYTNHQNKNAFDIIDLEGLKQTLWPPHCIQSTDGAALAATLNTNSVNTIIRKGYHEAIDSYSAFFDNGKRAHTGLDGFLKSFDVQSVYVCGLAADYCVYYTAMDALQLDYKTFIIDDTVKAIDQDDYKKKKDLFIDNSGHVILSSQL